MTLSTAFLGMVLALIVGAASGVFVERVRQGRMSALVSLALSRPPRPVDAPAIDPRERALGDLLPRVTGGAGSAIGLLATCFACGRAYVSVERADKVRLAECPACHEQRAARTAPADS